MTITLGAAPLFLVGMKLRCLIVDDEPRARLILGEYLQQLEGIEVSGSFGSALQAFQYIKEHPVSLVLLDINMPGITGFGLLDMLDPKPAVILTTAYPDYALKGFDYDVVDYLQKPVRLERFVKAMEKARRWIALQQTPAGPRPEYLNVRIDGKAVSINIADIRYLEGLRNYVKIHTDKGAYLVLMTMAEMEKMLPEDSFVRIHKSFIVRLASIRKTSLNTVYVGEAALTLGKTYKRYFQEAMKKYTD